VETDLMADAFHVFDPEGKGYVHTAEFPALIARLGQRVTAHEIDQMVQAMDREGTGKIHYQDYLSVASASVEDQRRHFPSDTVIFREGDTSDFFYLITAGKARTLLSTPPPPPPPPPTTHYPLLTTHYPLPTTHYDCSRARCAS
jgi:hypothetical protein